MNQEQIEPMLEDLKPWLSKPNIVGMYVGDKTKDGKITGEIAIVVHVVKKKDQGELAPDDLNIPNTVEGQIPTETGDYKTVQIPTDVVESGEPRLYRNDQRVRPCPGGYQIYGRWLKNGTGTLGVNIEWRGKYRLLTNNHVIAGNSEKSIGTGVYQPDKNSEGNRIAKVTGFEPIHTYPTKVEKPKFNTKDIAWCDIDKKKGSSKILGIGKIKGFRMPELNQRVRMMGSETGEVKESEIISIKYLIGFDKWTFPKNSVAYFERQILLSSNIAQPGDSGAAFVDDDNYIVGLCVGGFTQNAFGCWIL